MFTRPGIQARDMDSWIERNPDDLMAPQGLTGATARGLSNLLLGNGWLGTTVGRGGDLSKTIEYPG